MNEIKLEQYFDNNGKLGWDNMVKWSEETFWTNSANQKELLIKLKNNHDIAKVMYAKLGEESLEWIYKKISALDNLTPLECLETSDLIKRLKEALMRMP